MKLSLFKPLLVGFVLRSIVAICGIFFIQLPDSDADAVYNEAAAWSISQSNFWSIFQSEIGRSGSDSYIRFIGFIYYFSGRNPLLIVFIHVIFGSATIINVYRLIHYFWGVNWAKRCAWIVALFPSMILYSSIMLREAPIYFFSSLGLLYFLKWFLFKKIKFFVAFLICFIFATSFHSIFIVVPIFFFVYAWISQRLKQSSKNLLKRNQLVLISIMAILILVFTFQSGLKLSKFSSLTNDGLSVDGVVVAVSEAQRARSDSEDSRATYLKDVRPNNIIEFFWQLPVRIFYFLLTPFPWMISSLSDIIGFFDALLYLAFTLLIFKGRKIILNDKFLKINFYFLLVLLLVISIGTSNYGTAIRHRAKLVVFLMVLIPSYSNCPPKDFVINNGSIINQPKL